MDHNMFYKPTTKLHVVDDFTQKLRYSLFASTGCSHTVGPLWRIKGLVSCNKTKENLLNSHS